MIIKILNLYAGIGGNRQLWNNVEVTAIEINPLIADIYQAQFPHDHIIVADVLAWINTHQKQLLDFDMIWASPPCVTHTCVYKRSKFLKRDVPDLTSLYGLIIFFQRKLETKWIVENVQPWYGPLIQPRVILERHYFWSNFAVRSKNFNFSRPGQKQIQDLYLPELREYHNIPADLDFSDFTFKLTEKILRNCVHRELGKYILDESRRDNNLLNYFN